ncbi:hypothetical protein AM587_10002824 [Phytophthora nicotianae]|uniref:Uncharacterized protein n=1 Tax=Phytophthora nicotianae TaxID=4792 RepID=A0A0W8DWX3_PHYNI|nr:hypothetical protein AM587_10002824 [Phytophthora nicotianae]
MAPINLYALFKPGVLRTEGFAYGRTASEERQGAYDIERVPSGRWEGIGAFSAQRGAPEVKQRGVTEEEALSGIGTYVGSTLCIARVPQGKPKVWNYGVVVSYTWNNLGKSGVLQVTFADATRDLAFGSEEFQDLALETYALRPCYLRGTTDVMPAEMRALHNAAHDHFNGVGQSARRSTATVLKKISMNPVDESQMVPVYNLENTQVEFLKIEHILNFVFYREGKRRPPQGLSVPNALFGIAPPGAGTGGASPQAWSVADNERLEQLYDSDDDLDPSEPRQDERPVEGRPKRDREGSPQSSPDGQRESRLFALRQRLGDDAEMVQDIDQLIAFRQANLNKGSSTSLVSAAVKETKSQFRPSG